MDNVDKAIIKKYRKKPIVIEAMQWNDQADIKSFVPEGQLGWENGNPIIQTLEGPHICSYGDYIIKGIAGEFYPCKPDIFEATYDEVHDPSVVVCKRSI